MNVNLNRACGLWITIQMRSKSFGSTPALIVNRLHLYQGHSQKQFREVLSFLGFCFCIELVIFSYCFRIL